MMTTRFSLIGPGAVGSALARALVASGYRIETVVGEAPSVGRKLARDLGARWTVELGQIQADTGIILIAVPDSEVEKVARKLSRQDLPWRRIAVLHTAGVLGLEPLKPLERKGAGVGACHPFQTFPRRGRTPLLAGVTFGVDGNARGLRAARKIARDLGGKPLQISGQQRVLYHLAAVLACGFVSANLLMAQRVLCALGISEGRAREAILPIASGTISNIKELGVRAAMTGPAVRGDRTTIRKHLAELRKLDPELAKVYGKISGWVMGKGE